MNYGHITILITEGADMSIEEETEIWEAIVLNDYPTIAETGPMAGLVKPACRLVGSDGNIFAILGRAGSALKAAGYRDKAGEMNGRVFASGSYDEALSIVMEYVDAF